jgi:lipoprotein-anchoring transpeptidase ErfK/SrfK
MPKQQIIITATWQRLQCYENDVFSHAYPVSTGKNGLGEQMHSECTPRGWHKIHSIIGREHEENSVFVERKWTGEVYTEVLAKAYPARDWILTRIIQLEGLEAGRNLGGNVDTLSRFIYIHGTPDTTLLGVPGSHGCIRMRNHDLMAFAEWVKVGTPILIE